MASASETVQKVPVDARLSHTERTCE